MLRLAEVFRHINVKETGQLSREEFLIGLADHFGDMGFTEEAWESMF